MRFSIVSSAVTPLLVDHVDTDQIIPARFLRTVNREGLDDCLFADWKKNSDFVLLQPQYAHRSVLLAGHNFGCGSSREHAPWALLAGGFRVVIAASFADIFRSNALRNGLLPIQPSPADYAFIVEQVQRDESMVVHVDLQTETVTAAGRVVPFEVDAFSRDCLLRGVDRIEYLLAELPEIEAFEVRHEA